MKYLRVEMPDGSKWDVPLKAIAESRAAYYAKLDSEENGDDYATVYADEFELTMDDAYEAHDWASNNMNWDEVKAIARQSAPSKETDFHEGWVNGDKEIVEY